MIHLINDDYRNVKGEFDTIFADPPDNIDLGYDEFEDNVHPDDYRHFLHCLCVYCLHHSVSSYISFNAKWMTDMGHIFYELGLIHKDLDARWLIQGFTFGQNRRSDHTNNFRPIIRFLSANSVLYPDTTRVESKRMKMGDKRANIKGKVPGDVWFTDFLEYARVTGNSKQRRKYHPTQLHEGLVEDCLLMTTPEGGNVFDPFAGTGTTLRVCKSNDWNCVTTDISTDYCERIAAEYDLIKISDNEWKDNE